MMDYYNFHIEKSTKFLNSAKLLIAEGDDGASAISRAYYAMYTITEAVLFTKDINTKSHSGLLSQFNLYFIKSGIFNIEIGEWLHQAFVNRQAGDYNSYVFIEISEAQIIVDNAEKFIEILKQYLQQNKFI
ncbi:MAG: hypothetical protein RIQ33_126 [Bacteroidota bacterium]|jgi:uncharacterized protein (UPF0332 family)